MLRTSTLALLFALGTLAMAQGECGTGRYTDPAFFDSVVVQPGILFGNNNGVAGTPQDLYLDVYMPAGDTLTDRPVVIVAFGGSFVAGTRQDVAPICERFARRGFVAVAPDYRVGFFFPSEATTTRAVVRSMHDIKACVRFLRKSVDVDGDPYGIDPSRIIVGGVSAGAIGAIHATYLDQSSEIPPVIYGDTASIGGIEGNSGSPGYSSAVLACYSFSGAIGDSAWIQPGDEPLVSVHEVGDGVVPYYTQMVSVLGIPTGLTASGSHDIHVRCVNSGLTNCLLTYPGNGHVGYLTSDPVTSFNYVADFLAAMACNSPVACTTGTVSVAEAEDVAALLAYPNPTAGTVVIESAVMQQGYLLASDGRLVRALRLVPGPNPIDLGQLADGLYTLRTSQGASVRVVKASE
ncbi:MAG: carboxylesterase family protein [Flavobacteriales bacterium]|nr:carboxylesterase family protein [Flavobacteriales bacterium]